MNNLTGFLGTAGLLCLLGCTAQPIDSTQGSASADFRVANVGNAQEVAIQPTPMTPDRVVCRRETPTGSLIPRTRCYTQREIDQQGIEAREWLASDGLRGSLTVADPLSR